MKDAELTFEVQVVRDWRFRLGMLLLKAAMRLWGAKAVVDGEPV